MIKGTVLSSEMDPVKLGSILKEASLFRKIRRLTNGSGSGFFLLLLLDDRRIRIQEAQKHMDLTDPDPQDCL
jgi:hypothetical protein